MGKRRRFLLIALAILAIIMIGTAGYMIIEQWSFPDAIYMAVITLGTVWLSGNT
jgi:voltage-gated potassium channel